MQILKRLQFLASRLAKIDEEECRQAHAAVLDAINNHQSIERSSVAEQDLYDTVWGHITRALDYAEYPREYEMELDAIEGEMSGRVLGIRLAQQMNSKPTKTT
jgi:hypothetical protein